MTRIIAIIHAILVTIIAAYSCFYLCPIFGEDDRCRFQTLSYHALSALITIGYLLFDLLATLFFNHHETVLTYQTYAHHVAGILAFYTALLFQRESPFLMGAIANQFTEISTPFMNLRQLFFTHRMNEALIAKVNALLFAFSFMFGRLCFQAAFFAMMLPWLLKEHREKVWTNYSPYEQFGFYFCFAA